MKFIYVVIFFFLISHFSFSQEFNSDESRISFGTYIDPVINSILNEGNINFLENKLMSNITSSGMGSSNLSRFFITAKVDIQDREIVQSTEAMFLIKLNINLYVADNIEEKIFGSSNLCVSGTGESEIIAVRSAISKISSKEKSIESLLFSSRNLISVFYEKNCDFIIQDAKNKEITQQFDDALYVLNSIPNVCEVCYYKAGKEIVKIYKNKIDLEGSLLLIEAKAIWATSPTKNGGREALELISRINPSSNSVVEASNLIDDISNKIKVINNDEILQAKKRYNDKISLEKLRIESYRQIMTKYAENQPKQVYRTYFIW